MEQKQTKDFKLRGLEWKDAERGVFSGYASVYGVTDHHNDVVAPGAFTDSIKASPKVPLLWQHRTDEPLGYGRLNDSRDGLKITGYLNLDVQRAKEARSLMRQGALDGLSIGYNVQDKKYDGEVRVLTKLQLWEVSLVTFPANPLATVSDVKEMRSLLRDLKGLRRELETRHSPVDRKELEETIQSLGRLVRVWSTYNRLRRQGR